MFTDSSQASLKLDLRGLYKCLLLTYLLTYLSSVQHFVIKNHHIKTNDMQLETAG